MKPNTVTPRYNGPKSKGNPPLIVVKSQFIQTIYFDSLISYNRNPSLSDKIFRSLGIRYCGVQLYKSNIVYFPIQESLGGNARTTIIVCLSAETANESETRSSLHFGSRAMSVKNVVQVNINGSEEMMLTSNDVVCIVWRAVPILKTAYPFDTDKLPEG